MFLLSSGYAGAVALRLPDEARKLVESNALGHLVTLSPNGSPQVSCIWVGPDHDEIVSGHLNPAQRKLQNIARDARVALSIEGTENGSVVRHRRGLCRAASARRMEPRALVARRRDRLDDLARRLEEHDVAVRVIAADLADEAKVAPLLAEVAEMELDLLVNNAALAHYMPFAGLPLETAQTL